jgi:sulfur carrier protein ThiS
MTIDVKYGKITQALKTTTIEQGTSLGRCLKQIGWNFDSAIRVNGQAVSAEFVLQNNDVITSIDSIEGGF